MIGQGGRTISPIERHSGCRIKINQDPPSDALPGSNFYCTIDAIPNEPYANVELALRLLDDVIHNSEMWRLSVQLSQAQSQPANQPPPPGYISYTYVMVPQFVPTPLPYHSLPQLVYATHPFSHPPHDQREYYGYSHEQAQTGAATPEAAAVAALEEELNAQAVANAEYQRANNGDDTGGFAGTAFSNSMPHPAFDSHDGSGAHPIWRDINYDATLAFDLEEQYYEWEQQVPKYFVAALRETA